MNGNVCVSEYLSVQYQYCAQTVDRGERCLVPDLQCPR